MASIASKVGDIIPEGNFKNDLRLNAFKVMFTTVGTKQVKLGIKHDKIPAQIGRLIFTKESLGERENEGYLKHYDLKAGDTVINAGSYHGYFAIYVAKKVGPKGQVICFEPEPNNLRLLRKNIALNKLSNIKVIPKGLWSKDTILPLISMGSGSNLQPSSTWNKQKISVTTLDSAISKLKLTNINLITMDIEGAEIEALKGAVKTLNNNRNIHVAIASYHLLNSKPTQPFVEQQLRQNGLHSFSDYPPHPTTYGWYKNA